MPTTFRIKQDDDGKRIKIYSLTVTIADKTIKTEWETLRYIKLLRIQNVNVSFFIHPDKTIHAIVSESAKPIKQ
jgi:hypothetical protein